MDSNIGVLLLNLGGPDRVEDVYQFLFNLFSDPDLIRLPFPFLQKPIASLIAATRSPFSQDNYRAIGGGSPLRKITADQAQALQTLLQERGIKVRTYLGMRYWHPFTRDTIGQIKRDGITKLVVLPLYPQYSISTTGSSLKEVDQLWATDRELQTIERITIKSWYDRPGYIRTMAELIDREIAKTAQPDRSYIFFSAHGVPLKYVEKYNDPYQIEVENSVDLIMECLRREFQRYNAHTLAYQSRVGPVEWLKPYTEDAIHQLAKRGIQSLVVVPISFVSEHIETLQEIDIEYREVAEAAGIHHFYRVPALNTHPTFIADLANLVMESLCLSPVTTLV